MPDTKVHFHPASSSKSLHGSHKRFSSTVKEEQRDDGRLGGEEGAPDRAAGSRQERAELVWCPLQERVVTPGGCSDCRGQTALARGCHSCPGPHPLQPWALGGLGARAAARRGRKAFPRRQMSCGCPSSCPWGSLCLDIPAS